MTTHATTPRGAYAVSVVVAARNEEEHLRGCLEALRSQACAPPFEVIVVVNGSTDATLAIATELADTVIHEALGGQVHAKRIGVAASTGDVVAVLDADCVPDPHWIKAIQTAFASDSDGSTVAVTCAYSFQSGYPAWARWYVRCVHGGLIPLYRRHLNSMPYVIGGNVAFRRNAYHLAGGYDVRNGIADTEIGIARRLREAGRVVYDPGMVVRSSPRRFSKGVMHFARYKFIDYFGVYMVARLADRVNPINRDRQR